MEKSAFVISFDFIDNGINLDNILFNFLQSWKQRRDSKHKWRWGRSHSIDPIISVIIVNQKLLRNAPPPNFILILGTENFLPELSVTVTKDVSFNKHAIHFKFSSFRERAWRRIFLSDTCDFFPTLWTAELHLLYLNAHFLAHKQSYKQ